MAAEHKVSGKPSHGVLVFTLHEGEHIEIGGELIKVEYYERVGKTIHMRVTAPSWMTVERSSIESREQRPRRARR